MLTIPIGLQIRRFRSAPEIVEAYQVFRTGHQSVEGQSVWAQQFQWIVKHEDGKIEIMHEAEFAARFEALPPL